MFRFILVAFCFAVPVFGYPTGAPKEVCSNGLTPGHHTQPQTSEAPYSFSGADTVKAGEKILIKLSGDDFLGYVLQARNDKEEPVGIFKIVEANKSQLLTCSAEGDTLTHVQLDKKPINSVEFEWLAPADYKGNVKFVATVVKNYATFWAVDGFQKIELKNMPPAPEKIEFSTDSKYLYGMAHAISNGVVSADLANIKPGKIVHSRRTCPVRHPYFSHIDILLYFITKIMRFNKQML